MFSSHVRSLSSPEISQRASSSSFTLERPTHCATRAAYVHKSRIRPQSTHSSVPSSQVWTVIHVHKRLLDKWDHYAEQSEQVKSTEEAFFFLWFLHSPVCPACTTDRYTLEVIISWCWKTRWSAEILKPYLHQALHLFLYNTLLSWFVKSIFLTSFYWGMHKVTYY